VKVPRFRVAWIMGLVAIAALNFGAIRAVSDLATANRYNPHVMLVIKVLGTGVMLRQGAGDQSSLAIHVHSALQHERSGRHVPAAALTITPAAATRPLFC
jgi:hypothetical protein